MLATVQANRPSMILEPLQRANPRLEFWWDSLPTTYAAWSRGLADQAPASDRPRLTAALSAFFDPDSPAGGLARGATTNGRLFHAALLRDAARWTRVLRDLADPGDDTATLHWRLYTEVYRQNAALMRPLWEATEGRHGWVCAQVTPDVAEDEAAMVRQGLALAAIAPNVMVKVVGSAAGYRAIEALTAAGVSTNATFSFSVSQLACGIEAVQRGLAIARAKGMPLGAWRSVFTYMAGRVGAEPSLHAQAAERGLSLGPSDIRWAEIAIARRIDALADVAGRPVKPLMCSIAIDPDGGCTHLSALAGSDWVFTLSPPVLAALAATDRPLAPDPGPVPDSVLARLSPLPYFQAVYEPNGLAPEAFAAFPAFVTALGDARAAQGQTWEWIRARRGRAEGER
jgi:transaldolase